MHIWLCRNGIGDFCSFWTDPIRLEILLSRFTDTVFFSENHLKRGD